MALRNRDIVDILCEYQIIPNNVMEHFGEIDEDKRIIYIKSSQTRQEMQDTIVHELLHAYYFIKGITHSERQIEDETKQLIRRWYRR